MTRSRKTAEVPRYPSPEMMSAARGLLPQVPVDFIHECWRLMIDASEREQS